MMTEGRITKLKMSELESICDLSLGPMSQECVNRFRGYLGRWNSIEPDYVFRSISWIRDLLKQTHNQLQENLASLQKPIADIQNLRTDVLWYWLISRIKDDTTLRSVFDFILNSWELSSRLKQFNDEAEAFNRRLLYFEEHLSSDSTKNEATEKIEWLKKEASDLVNEMRKLDVMLADCRIKGRIVLKG